MNDASANDTLKEQLSALMDGELSSSESAFLIKRIGREPELRAWWQRQCMARDVARNEHPANFDLNLADRLHVALASEPAPASAKVVNARGARAMPSWMRPLAGFAVAASVASVAIVGWQGTQDMSAESESAKMTAKLANIDSSALDSGKHGELWVTQGLKPQLNAQNAAYNTSGNDRLDAYLLQHQEQSMMIGAPGWIPYSRIVGHDSAGYQTSPRHSTYVVGGQ